MVTRFSPRHPESSEPEPSQLLPVHFATLNLNFKWQSDYLVCMKCLVLPRCLYPPRTVSQTESRPSTARVGRKVMTRLGTSEP